MSKFNVPLNEPQKDRFRDRLDEDSVSDSRIRQQYIKDGAFEKFKDNYLKETKTFIGIVIKIEEMENSAEFLTRINPLANNEKTFVAVRARIPQLHSMIPEPCGLGTDDGAKKKGIFEMHPLFVGHVDGEPPKVGDYVQVSFKKGPSGGNQKEGILHGVYQRNQPPAGADNECDTLISLFEQNEERSLGETTQIGPPSSYPVQRDISALLPSVQVAVRRVIRRMNSAGFDAYVYEAVRSPERAQALANAGVGVVRSMHIEKVAVDIISRSKQWYQNEANPDEAGAPFWNKLGEIAESEGFIWGGRWTSGRYAPYGDRPHIQAVAVSEQEQLRALRTDEEKDNFVSRSLTSRLDARSGDQRSPVALRAGGGNMGVRPSSETTGGE